MYFKIKEVADALKCEYTLFPQLKDGAAIKAIENDPQLSNELKKIMGEAKKNKDLPIETLKFSKFRLFDTTGDRAEFESQYFARRRRLGVAALLSILGYDEYLSETEDMIWAICDEYTWCLPAHLGSGCNHISVPNMYSKDGNIYGTAVKQENALDLFSCETAATLAEICYFLEGKISPLVIQRARTLIKERVLDSYLSMHNNPWWATCEMNWAAVCGGSIGIAAIYLIKDSMALTKILSLIMLTLDSFLSGFSNDGATTEGVAYWSYGFGFFVYFAQLLFERTNGKIDLLMSEEKIKNIVLFPQKSFISDYFIVNFSDCGEKGKIEPCLCNLLTKRFEDFEIIDGGFNSFDINNRWICFFRNFLWLNASDKKKENIKNSEEFFPDCQWLVSKNKIEIGYFSFAAKGGNNKEDHNHNDVGSFILHCSENTFICDLGPARYVNGYFGAERYQHFQATSQAHNLPIIDGGGQIDGDGTQAQVLDISLGEKTHYKLDITKAYHNHSGVKSIIREFYLDHKNKSLKLIDTAAFEKVPNSFTERFITKLKPEIIGNNVVIKGENAECMISCNLSSNPIISEKILTAQNVDKEFEAYIIDFPMNCESENINAEFIFSLSE